MAIGDPFPRKVSKRVSTQDSTPPLSVIGPKPKARPRGKSFEKGNGFGSEHRFKKGCPSPNPGGRPKSAYISEALRAKLKSETTKPLKARTYAEKLVDEWVEQGLDGNVAAIAAIADRAEGRPAITVVSDGRPDNLTLWCESIKELHLAQNPQLVAGDDLEDENENE